MLNDLGNAYVATGDVTNAIDTLREAVDSVAVMVKVWVVCERSGQCVCGGGYR